MPIKDTTLPLVDFAEAEYWHTAQPNAISTQARYSHANPTLILAFLLLLYNYILHIHKQ